MYSSSYETGFFIVPKGLQKIVEVSGYLSWCRWTLYNRVDVLIVIENYSL